VTNTSGTPYEIKLSTGARLLLTDRLPPSVAFAAWEFIDGPLRREPHRVGKPLHQPFEGCWSARRGTYRIRYEISDKTHAVHVLDIAPRADAYLPGRA
jgi:mRNA interferase RelE/StbE